MIYGEDSGEGYVRGRSFLHPRLGIAFTAPEGFLLENTPQAVLGMTPGATEALRFDSARLPPEHSLEAFITENRIEGLALTEVQPLEVNGLVAATGVARGSDWTFRIFAARTGGQVYRMIMAARAFTPETDQRFMEAFRSFRVLGAAEAARIRPLRLALVVARPGDTMDRLARGMGEIDRPVERFAVLNGLDRDAALEPGRAYKTVVD